MLQKIMENNCKHLQAFFPHSPRLSLSGRWSLYDKMNGLVFFCLQNAFTMKNQRQTWQRQRSRLGKKGYQKVLDLRKKLRSEGFLL